ncbi:hypothetical protein MKX07_000299 [Trichoderma sp. CBMAI-0711]|nr:hypothetical protein MKX07_000299 [Trichoderma sp. CBMAI-0711]
MREPAPGEKVPRVRLQQGAVNVDAPHSVAFKRRPSGVVPEDNGPLKAVHGGHSAAQDVHGKGVVASSAAGAALLVPERHPFVPRQPARLVAQLGEGVEERRRRDGPGVAQVVDELLAVRVVRQRDDGAGDDVDGRHLDDPVRHVGGLAELQRLDDEGVEEVVRVGRAGDAVPADGARAVDPGRDAAPAGLDDELLGHPLCLAVAVLQPRGHVVKVDHGVFGPALARGRQDAVGRDVVHRRAAAGGQPEYLPRAADVCAAQGRVRVDEVDRRRGVDNDLHARRELLKGLWRQAEAAAREVAGDNLHAVEHRVAPDAEVDEVLADAGGARGPAVLGRLGEAHHAEDVRRGVLQEGLEQEGAQVARRPGEQDRLGVAEALHLRRRDMGLDVLGQVGVCAEHGRQVGLDLLRVAVASGLDGFEMALQGGIAGERTERDGEAERLAQPTSKVGQDQRVAAQVEEVVLGRDARDGDVEGRGPHLDNGVHLDGDVPLRLGGDLLRRPRARRRRQRLEVRLAGDGVRGQLLELNPQGRDHVMRQVGRERAAGHGAVARLVNDDNGAALDVVDVGDDVGHQLLLQALSVGDDGAVAHREMLDNGRLDGAGLDRVAARLDHAADAARDLEEARRKHPRHVAGAVHPGALLVLDKGVHLEGGRRGLGQVEVLPREKVAANKQLAADAGLEPVARLVEDVDVLRVDGRPDGTDAGLVVDKRLDVAHGNLVRLAGAVDVEEASVGQRVARPAYEIRRDDLAVQPQ